MAVILPHYHSTSTSIVRQRPKPQTLNSKPQTPKKPTLIRKVLEGVSVPGLGLVRFSIGLQGLWDCRPRVYRVLRVIGRTVYGLRVECSVQSGLALGLGGGSKAP